MTRRAKCPACKDADRGTNPAGRCDACHADVELRKTCCTDCLAEGREPKKCMPVNDKYPGRRCMTHGRAAVKAARLAAHARRVETGYGITGEQYWALYAAQGGRCALCQRATGKSKRLAVDHDHKMAAEVCGHDPRQGCSQCVRGLLCGPCNQYLVVHPVETLLRAINYRYDPPAREVLSRLANLDFTPTPTEETPA